MKNKKIINLLPLGLLLVGCNENVDVGQNCKVNFVSGYEGNELTLEVSNGESVNKPNINNMTILGYYADETFESEVSFPLQIKEDTTIYVKGYQGSGSEDDPYLISSSNSLNTFAHYGSEITGYFKITNDFEITTKYSENFEKSIINGVIDGGNHTITLSNYLEKDVSYGYGDTSLFYKIGEQGSVSDLIFVGAINGKHPSVGTLACYNDGYISNIKTYGVSEHASNGYNSGVRLMTVWDDENEGVIEDFGTAGDYSTLNKGIAGGIVGTNNGTIKDCFNRMNVSATIGGGGIAGVNNGNIVNCFNGGAIGTTGNSAIPTTTHIRDHKFDFSLLGGISGVNYGTINQCGNLNQVFTARLPWKYQNAPAGQSDYTGRIRAGGIAGVNMGTFDETKGEYTSGIISECFNYGRVHADMFVGGIAGYTSGLITDCENYSETGARFCLGGIAGWQSGDKENDHIAVVKNCVSVTRMTKGSAGSYTDENGTTVAGIAFEQLSSSVSTSSVVEYYHIAKYATNCIYNSNCGTSLPLDPNTNEVASSIMASPSKMENESLLAIVNSNDKFEQENINECTAIAGFNSSWQAFISLRLKWMSKKVTYVNGNDTGSFIAVCGVDYINHVLEKSGDTFSSSLKSNYTGACQGRGLPTISGKWLTDKDDPNSVFDGVVTSDITLYAAN